MDPTDLFTLIAGMRKQQAGGMFGPGVQDMTSTVPPPQRGQIVDLQQPKPSGGMFGNGKFGIGQAIVAALNGYLAGTGNPVGMANMQMMQQMMEARRRHQQDLEDYSRKRQDDNTDWQAHYDYQVAHPQPGQPGEFEDALTASGVQPGTPQWTEAMKQRVGNILDPVVMTPQGPMLRSQVVGALQQPEILQSLPPGAKPIGGPTQPASGGFPY